MRQSGRSWMQSWRSWPMRNEISDASLDAHYARDYYGPGTDYFEPPDFEEDLLEDDLGVLDEEMEDING